MPGRPVWRRCPRWVWCPRCTDKHGAYRYATVKPKPCRVKRLQDIRGELERGVFLALYRSRKQRHRRALAVTILSFKHGLRGLAFTWPFYAVAIAAIYLPGVHWLVFLALILPGVGVSAHIFLKGIREDYRHQVRDVLLEKGYARCLVST